MRVAAAGCDVILHQAAMKSVPRSLEEPERYTDVNVLGTLNVLLAARDASASVVSASSSSVYGDQARFPLTEDAEPRPRSPVCRQQARRRGLLSSVVGVLRRSDGLAPLLQRLRPRAGPGQRLRRGRSRGSPSRASPAARPRSTATGSRRATSRSSTTSSRRTCSRRERPTMRVAVCSTSAAEPNRRR